MVKLIKLKYKDLIWIKSALITCQGDFCPICDRNLMKLPSRERCLDHNHKTGAIRAVLCRGCNSMEGKVWRTFQRMGLAKAKVNYMDFLERLALYTLQEDTKYIHPKYKEKK